MHRPEPGAEPGLAPRASGRKERLAASPPRARPGPRAMLLRESPPRRGLACEGTGDVLSVQRWPVAESSATPAVTRSRVNFLTRTVDLCLVKENH